MGGAMARRYLGYGTTNDKGIATLDHDINKNALTHSYTGVGEGKFNIVAESGIVQSDRKEVIDATILDRGTSANPNAIWYNQQNAQLDRYSEYSEITENGGTAILRTLSTNALDKTDICVEFDFYQSDGATSNNFMSFINTTGSSYLGAYSLSQLNLQSGAWHHIKLVVDSDGYVTPNDITSAKKQLNFSTEKMFFGFLTNGDTTTVRFRNFVIYPLYDTVPTNLTVSANNPTITTGETSTLTVTAKGENNYPVKNISIDLYDGENKLTTIRTDNTGKATYTYTGVGNGLHSFQAKYSTLQSEIFAILDALFYDEAVNGHKNENTYYNANCEETVSDTGTTVAYTGSTYYMQYRFGQTNSTDKPFSIGTIIEFDIIDITGMNIIFYGNSNYNRALPTSPCHMKIVVDTDYITLYQDDTQIAQVQTSNYISNTFSFGFTINSSGKYIKYKEMKIYPV